MRFSPSLGGPLIDQAEHAALEAAVGLSAHDGGGQADLLAAGGNRLVAQNNRADGLVVVLNRTDEAERELLKIVGYIHRERSPVAAGITVARRSAMWRRQKTGYTNRGAVVFREA